jgi:hypothetical protein
MKVIAQARLEGNYERMQFAKKLAGKGYPEEAFEFASFLDSYYRSEVMADVAAVFLERGDKERAADSAAYVILEDQLAKLSERIIEGGVLPYLIDRRNLLARQVVELARPLIRRGTHDEAALLAEHPSMPATKEQSQLYRMIAEDLLDRKQREAALKTAAHIKHGPELLTFASRLTMKISGSKALVFADEFADSGRAAAITAGVIAELYRSGRRLEAAKAMQRKPNLFKELIPMLPWKDYATEMLDDIDEAFPRQDADTREILFIALVEGGRTRQAFQRAFSGDVPFRGSYPGKLYAFEHILRQLAGQLITEGATPEAFRVAQTLEYGKDEVLTAVVTEEARQGRHASAIIHLADITIPNRLSAASRIRFYAKWRSANEWLQDIDDACNRDS